VISTRPTIGNSNINVLIANLSILAVRRCRSHLETILSSSSWSKSQFCLWEFNVVCRSFRDISIPVSASISGGRSLLNSVYTLQPVGPTGWHNSVGTTGCNNRHKNQTCWILATANSQHTTSVNALTTRLYNRIVSTTNHRRSMRDDQWRLRHRKRENFISHSVTAWRRKVTGVTASAKNLIVRNFPVLWKTDHVDDGKRGPRFYSMESNRVSWNFRQYINVAECNYLPYFYAHDLQMSSVWLYGKNTSFYGNGYYGTRHCGIGVSVALRLYNRGCTTGCDV